MFSKKVHPQTDKMKKSKSIEGLKGKGLFIGINYSGSNALKGCINDSLDLSRYFTTKGFECKLMTSGQTKKNIINEIRKLSLESYQGTKNFIIQYSGHGTRVSDRNGDEKDGQDEALVSSDLLPITDDELFVLITSFHPNSRIFIIVDACHSGSCFDLPYSYITMNSSSDYVNTVMNEMESGCFKQNDKSISQKVVMISGCRDPEYSMDSYSNRRREHCGALSNALSSYGDFIEMEVFNLKATVEADIAWCNQRPCVSSSFPLTNSKISDIFS